MNWENFLIQSEDLFFLLEDTMIWNNIHPAETHKLERFQNVARKSEEVEPPCFRERHNILGVDASLLQCSKGTDQLKVWETLL